MECATSKKKFCAKKVQRSLNRLVPTATHDESNILPKKDVAVRGSLSIRQKCFLCILMSLQITAINSGSNGNCYYVGNQKEAVLIDVGISCTAVEKRMALLGLPMSRLKAIFVSHEHTDHTKGVSTLANKYALPVYINNQTASNGPRLIKHLSVNFAAHLPIAIGDLRIIAFPKCHDASDPHSFLISDHNLSVGVFTDHGTVCDQTIHYFKKCHAAFLESNYDETMLQNGPYSEPLKERIRGGMGHLSNSQALELFKAHRPPFMTHLILSHLSRTNNTPAIASQLFMPHAGNIVVIVASRVEATPVFSLAV